MHHRTGLFPDAGGMDGGMDANTICSPLFVLSTPTFQRPLAELDKTILFRIFRAGRDLSRQNRHGALSKFTVFLEVRKRRVLHVHVG